MMKPTRWKKHYRSRYQFPTVQGKSGNTVGHVKAKRDLEDALKRPLKAGFKIVTRAGNWCFMEPK